MENNNRKTKEYLNISFNPYTVLSDLIKNMWIIISLSISVACFSYIQSIESYEPSYTVRATYIVTARGVNNDLITAMKKSQESANRFAEIINSRALLNEISSETGYKTVNIFINAIVISETNLVQVEIYGKTPQYAFSIFQAMTHHYPEIVNKTITNATVGVLVEPTVGSNPSYVISPLKTMLKYFAIGVVGLTAFFMMLSCIKDTVRSGHDVEKKLDTDYLGEVCHEKKIRKRKKAGSDAILISKNTVSFRYVECIQRISRKIQNIMHRKNFSSLLVTSCLQKEGKSTIAANIALSMAEQGKKVLLIDLDLRKPAQYRMFNSSALGGDDFREVLNGKKSIDTIIGKLKDIEVYTVFNSNKYTNSTEILTNGVIKEILDGLKIKGFDYIIIDSSAMELTADTEVLAEYVDAVLVVVKEHYARAKAINDRLDALYNCKAKVIGCIVNNVHLQANTVPGYGYNYRSYAYGYYDERRE